MLGQSFHQAAERWRQLVEAEADDEEFEAVERQIIEHDPVDDNEAAIVLQVLASSFAGGERTDGADLMALVRVAAFLQRPTRRTDAAA